MNAEVIRAMNRKKSKPASWWRKNYYKITRVIFFPLYLIVKNYEFLEKKYRHWVLSHNQWDEDRIKEIMNYYIPRTSSWDAEKKQFYFFDNGYGWDMYFAKKHLKKKDRKFWSVHNGLYGGKIRNYLINSFELDGFTKEVLCCDDGRTEITFTLKG